MARLFAGRFQLFIIEEIGEFVFLCVESGLLVKLILQLQDFDTEAVKSAVIEFGAYRIIQCFDNKVVVYISDGATEDANPETVDCRAVCLTVHAGAGEIFRRLDLAAVSGKITSRMLGALRDHHHGDTSNLNYSWIISADALFLNDGDALHLEMFANAGSALRQ